MLLHGFTIRQALFAQHDSIDNIEIGGGGGGGGGGGEGRGGGGEKLICGS